MDSSTSLSASKDLEGRYCIVPAIDGKWYFYICEWTNDFDEDGAFLYKWVRVADLEGFKTREKALERNAFLKLKPELLP